MTRKQRMKRTKCRRAWWGFLEVKSYEKKIAASGILKKIKRRMQRRSIKCHYFWWESILTIDIIPGDCLSLRVGFKNWGESLDLFITVGITGTALTSGEFYEIYIGDPGCIDKIISLVDDLKKTFQKHNSGFVLSNHT